MFECQSSVARSKKGCGQFSHQPVLKLADITMATCQLLQSQLLLTNSFDSSSVTSYSFLCVRTDFLLDMDIQMLSSNVSTKVACSVSVVLCLCSFSRAMIWCHCSTRTQQVYLNLQVIHTASLVCFRISFLLHWTSPYHSC